MAFNKKIEKILELISKNKQKQRLQTIDSPITEHYQNKDDKEELFVIEKNNVLRNVEEQLSTSIVGPNIFKYLDFVKDKYDIQDVIELLNKNQNWVAKDNLIKFLFHYYS